MELPALDLTKGKPAWQCSVVRCVEPAEPEYERSFSTLVPSFNDDGVTPLTATAKFCAGHGPVFEKAMSMSIEDWYFSVSIDTDERKHMRLNEYQRLASSTADYPGRMEPLGLVYCALSAAGEAGELANKAKKTWRDHDLKLTDEMREAIIGEAGDTLWYLSALADELGITLEDIAKYNLEKLLVRYPERSALMGRDN